MATGGEVVVHLYLAHDIGLLLVALSYGIVLAIGLWEPEINKFKEPTICLLAVLVRKGLNTKGSDKKKRLLKFIYSEKATKFCEISP